MDAPAVLHSVPEPGFDHLDRPIHLERIAAMSPIEEPERIEAHQECRDDGGREKSIGEVTAGVAQRSGVQELTEGARFRVGKLRMLRPAIVEFQPTHAAGSPGFGSSGAGSAFHFGFLQVGHRTGKTTRGIQV